MKKILLTLALIFASTALVGCADLDNDNDVAIPVNVDNALNVIRKTNNDNRQVVQMTTEAFTPAVMNITSGSTVVFITTDEKSHWPATAIHPVHDIYPEFDAKRGITSGEEWSFTFEEVGAWSYHDHLNPSIRGKIIVQ